MRLVSTSRHLSSMKASQRRAVDSSPALSRHSATFSIRLRMNRGTWRRNAARNRWPCSNGLERSQGRHHCSSWTDLPGCEIWCKRLPTRDLLQKQNKKYGDSATQQCLAQPGRRRLTRTGGPAEGHWQGFQASKLCWLEGAPAERPCRQTSPAQATKLLLLLAAHRGSIRAA